MAGKTIQIERVYKASPEDAWELWATKEGIESWWGPGGFFVKVQTLDLRVGGALEYTMTTKDPDELAFLEKAGMPSTTRIRATFSEVTPYTRLAYVTHADFFPGHEPEDVTTVVEFRPIPGGIRLVLTLDTFSDPRLNTNMEMGWKMELEKLAGRLEP